MYNSYSMEIGGKTLPVEMLQQHLKSQEMGSIFSR